MRDKVKELIESEFKQIRFVKEKEMKLFYECIDKIDYENYIEKIEYSIKQLKHCNILYFYIEYEEKKCEN
ncbi:MAG: hypothetical protein ACRC5R_04340 [Mycoplasmatales bacterium]